MSSPSKPRQRRSYDQHCALARAMDVIGERWTVLLVRELLLGPKRYKDLLAALPGIGTNLLAARLRELEEAGLVQRDFLPPPAGSAVYELTENGQALEPALRAVGRWGARFLGEPRPTDVLAPGAYLVAMGSTFRSEATKGVREKYEVRVAGRVFEVGIDGGRCTIREDRPSNPDVVLELETDTLYELLFGKLAPAEALDGGRVAVLGDPDALDRFVRIFAIRPSGAEEMRSIDGPGARRSIPASGPRRGRRP